MRAGVAIVLFGMACGVGASAQFPRTTTDPAAVDRGAKIYAKDCARCHGDDARGTSAGSDMLRSTLVLHDRRESLRGKELAPYLKNTPPHKFDYNAKEATDLSNFLSASINSILRSGYDDHPKGLLDGDAKAGEAFFNGAGGCSKCHSVTGDMAGVGKRYTSAALQQKWLFPQSGIGKKALPHVTVTAPGARSMQGDLVRIDDFTVTWRDANGTVRSLNRTGGLKVAVTDPYAAHADLLNHLNDADIHNMTTFLDTLR